METDATSWRKGINYYIGKLSKTYGGTNYNVSQSQGTAPGISLYHH